MAGKPKKKEECKTHEYRVRLNDEEWSELQYLKGFDDFKISDFLREGIHVQYLVMVDKAKKNGLNPSKK